MNSVGNAGRERKESIHSLLMRQYKANPVVDLRLPLARLRSLTRLPGIEFDIGQLFDKVAALLAKG